MSSTRERGNDDTDAIIRHTSLFRAFRLVHLDFRGGSAFVEYTEIWWWFHLCEIR
jgi:hypothetical protein